MGIIYQAGSKAQLIAHLFFIVNYWFLSCLNKIYSTFVIVLPYVFVMYLPHAPGGEHEYVRRLGSYLDYTEGFPGLMKETDPPTEYKILQEFVLPDLPEKLENGIHWPEFIELLESENYLKPDRYYKLYKMATSSDSSQAGQFIVMLDEYCRDSVVATPDPSFYPGSPFHFSPMSPGALGYKPSTPSTVLRPGVAEVACPEDFRPVILFDKDKQGLIKGWIHRKHRIFNCMDIKNLPDTVFIKRKKPTNNIKIEQNKPEMRVFTKKGHIKSGMHELLFEVMTRVNSPYPQQQVNEKAVSLLAQVFMCLSESERKSFLLGTGWTCSAYTLPEKGHVNYDLAISLLQNRSCLSGEEIVKVLDGYVIKPYANDRIRPIYKRVDQRFQVNQSRLYKELHESVGLRLVDYMSFIVPVKIRGRESFVMVDRQVQVEDKQFLHKIIEGELEKGNVDYIVDIFYKILDEVVGPMFWVNHYIPDLEISVDTNTKNFVLGEDGFLYLTDLSPPAAIWRGRIFTAYNFLNGEDNNDAWRIMFKLLCKPIFQFCYPLVKMWIHGPALKWFVKNPMDNIPFNGNDFAATAFREYMRDTGAFEARSDFFNQISGVINMAAQSDKKDNLGWFSNVLDDMSKYLNDQGFHWFDYSDENIERLINYLISYRQPRMSTDSPTASSDIKKQLLKLVVLSGIRLVTHMRLKEGDPPHPFCPRKDLQCKVTIEASDEVMDEQEAMDIDELMVVEKPRQYPFPGVCMANSGVTGEKGTVSPVLSVLDAKPFKDQPSSVLALSVNCRMECSRVPVQESVSGMNSPCEVFSTKINSSEKVSVEESLDSSMDITAHYGVVEESVHTQSEEREQEYLTRVDVKKERSTPSPEACRKLSFSDASEYGVELKPAIIKRDSAKRKLQKYIDYTQNWLMAENGGRGLKLELRRQGIRAPEIPGNLAVIFPRGCFNKHPDAFRDTLDRVGDEFLVKNSRADGCQYKLCQDNRDDVAVSNWDFIVQNTSCANVKAFFGDKKLVSNLVRVCLPKISSVMRDAVCMTALATSRDVGLDYKLDAVVLIDLKGYPYYESESYTLYLHGKIYKGLTQKDITNFMADHSKNENDVFEGKVKVFIGLFVCDDKDLEGNAADMYFQTQECSAGACDSRVLLAEDLSVRDISLRDDSCCDDSMMEGVDVIDDIEHQRRVNTSTDSGIVSGYSTSPDIGSFLILDEAEFEEVDMEDVFQGDFHSQPLYSPPVLPASVCDMNAKEGREASDLIDKLDEFDHVQMLNFVCYAPFFIFTSMDILSSYQKDFRRLPRFLEGDFYTYYKVHEQYLCVCGLEEAEVRERGVSCHVDPNSLYEIQEERRAFMISVLACLLERDSDYSSNIKEKLGSLLLAQELNCVFREATGHFLNLSHKDWCSLLFSGRTPHYFYHNDSTAQPIARVFSTVEKARAIISAISKRYDSNLIEEHEFYKRMAWNLNECMTKSRGSRSNIRETMDLSLFIASYWLQNRQKLINTHKSFQEALLGESTCYRDVASIYRKIFEQFWVEPLRDVAFGFEPLTGYISLIDVPTALIKAEFFCELCQVQFDDEKTTTDYKKQHNPSKYCMRCKFAAARTSESCSLCSETLSNYSQGACCAICKRCFEDIEQLKSHILLHTRLTSNTGHSMTSKHMCALCRQWFDKKKPLKHMKDECPIFKVLFMNVDDPILIE